MKEYSIAAVIASLMALGLDRLLGTRLSSSRAFWIFWAVMAGLITVVNGYLTWRPIVLYGEEFFLGIRVFTIPVEDYLFGFALITMNLVIWEYFSNDRKN
jgi:lycopene cyclase domain-containing protein